MRWRSATVDGHRVRYGVVGTGPGGPVHARVGTRGPTPTADRSKPWPRPGAGSTPPACPDSAAPASSTPSERTFAGYARWVGDFLDAWGSREVALVAGHSFGGGVATAFVYAQPGGSSALLLVNAIGSPTWALFPNEVRTTMQRPVWDWGRHFSTDLLHSPHLVRMLPTLLEDFIPNLLGNPLGHVPDRRVHPPGRPGRRGPRPSPTRGIPVSVAWSDRDRSGVPVGLRRAPPCGRCRGRGRSRAPTPGSSPIPSTFRELAISALVDSGALTPRSAIGTSSPGSAAGTGSEPRGAPVGADGSLTR